MAKTLRLVFAALLTVALARDAAAHDRPAAMSYAAYEMLSAVVDVLKQHHVNRGKVDWPSLEDEAFAMVSAAQKPRDTAPAIQFLIRSLGERHTFLIGSAQWKAMTSGETSGTARGAAFGTLPVANLMQGGIGYLALPGHDGSASDDVAYVAVLRNALRLFRTRGVCRFIVDLRGNAGGNMFPMQSGLVSLLGRGPYGYWDDGAGLAPWPDPEKVARMDGIVAGPYAARPADQSRAAVAVLIDRRTASSGESAAIAFEGRPRARLFGEPTAGLTTGNEAFALPDGMHIAVTTVRAMDRNKRPFPIAVVPDVETPPGAETNDAALAWLRAQRCPR